MKEINLLILTFMLSACASTPKSGDPMIDPILSKREQFRQCYLESDSYSGKDKVETGTVDIAFTVDPHGHVRAERIIETSFKDANLHACILHIAKQIEFPISKKGESIEIAEKLNFGTVHQ